VFDALAKLILETDGLCDDSSDFIIGYSDEGLGLWIGGGQPSGGIRETAQSERMFLNQRAPARLSP
jgi:hypothetical protein